VPLEGLSGLTSQVDPMGGQLVCKSRQVSRRRPPEDIGRSLGLEAGEPMLVIRCVWTVGGEPGALSASYLPERLGQLWPDLAAPPFPPPGKYPPVDGLSAVRPADGEAARPPADEPRASAPAVAGTGSPPPMAGAGSPPPRAGAAGEGTTPAAAPRPRALQIELAPPPPSVARSLRLAAGELVATVTVNFEDPVAHQPVAITTAMLRPDLFRIVIQAGAGPDGRTDGFASAWTHAATGWEP
jgi:hypothetical protein